MIDSQNKAILSHLLNGGKLSGIDALNMFGCFRLPARVHDLKQMGYNITGSMVQNGKKRYKVYGLEK